MEHYHIERRSGGTVTRTEMEGAIYVARALGTQMWSCRGAERCPESLTTPEHVKHAAGWHYQAFDPACSFCQSQGSRHA
jgi:hypothetical protein